MPPRSRSKTPVKSPARSRSKTPSKAGDEEPVKMIGGTRAAMSGAAVAKDESKKAKIMERVFWGVIMVVGFLGVLWAGHVWVCGLVFLLEVLLFKELVKVRYNRNIDTIKKQIPMFKTTQWAWFSVAIFYCYSDFLMNLMLDDKENHEDIVKYGGVQLTNLLTFGMYAGVFVLSIVTLQKDHIKFQINQLTWTLTIIILTVGQLKYIMHNLFNGMIWFCLPVLLVVVNDIMAYVCGMTCGKKFINRPFLKLSPNKTWEGFIGGGICTIIIGWYLAKLLAQFNWMICPAPITLWSDALTCEPDPLYVNGHLEIPEQVFELLPVSVGRWIPGITEFCRTAKSSSADVAACVSGAKPYLHHHFELSFPVLPIQVHAIPLAIFASVVAPFGGFLASGIKRAYDIKDFDNTIPGHGGIMDRMDCQFLMALCTWVHYNAFVRMTTVSVAKLLFLFKLLPDGEQAEFVKEIAKFAAQ